MSSIDDWAAAPASGASIDDWAGASAPAAASTPTPAHQVATQDQPGFWSSLGAGLGHGFGSTVLGAEQLAGHGLSALAPAGSPAELAANAIMADANKGLKNLGAQYSPYAAARPLTAGAGNLVGSAAAAAPLTVGAGIPGAIASGALTGATQPVNPDSQDFWSDKLANAAAGAAGGGVLGGGASLAGRVLAPNINPAIQRLMAAGVIPTPGMIAGGGANRAEQSLTSVPFIGSSISGARNRAIDSFNHAAYADALAPIGAAVPAGTEAGGAGVDAVNDLIGRAYDSIENRAQFNYDGQLHRDISGIRNTLSQTASPQTLDQFDNILRNQVTQKMDPNTGEMTGPQWGTTRSMLSTLQRQNTLGQPTADQTALASAVGDLRDAVNSNVVRNSAPDVQTDLANANSAYARYKRIEQAAGYTGARRSGNVFTPADYSRAVGAQSSAYQKATGTGLNSPFALDAEALSTNVPNSGTPERAGTIATILALPHIIAHPGIIPAGLAARAAYSPTGVGLMGRLMTARSAAVQAAGNMVRSAAPGLSVLGGAAGGQLPNYEDEAAQALGTSQ